MISLVDESLRSGPAGLYVVTAVVVLEDRERARGVARSVLLPRQPRFHWRGETHGQRQKMLGAMAELELPVRGYVYRALSPRKQERARALCFERLLWDLQEDGIEELLVESRQSGGDRRDRRTIVRAQRSGKASGSLRYGFAFAVAEPLLWFADAAAGAVAMSTAGEEATYLEQLGSCAEVIEIDP